MEDLVQAEESWNHLGKNKQGFTQMEPCFLILIKYSLTSNFFGESPGEDR